MRIPSPNAKRKARIEIIPLIDIIFFLLATFVMVSLSMIKNKGIPVNLPVASSGAPQERKDYTSITVTETGELLFNKENIHRSELGARLSHLKAAGNDPRVFINGDAKADFENVVAVLDEARKNGINKVAIETKPRPAGSS
jgi:biopolymer transport protein ExbD